jgi:hypothetical protein
MALIIALQYFAAVFDIASDFSPPSFRSSSI